MRRTVPSRGRPYSLFIFPGAEGPRRAARSARGASIHDGFSALSLSLSLYYIVSRAAAGSRLLGGVFCIVGGRGSGESTKAASHIASAENPLRFHVAAAASAGLRPDDNIPLTILTYRRRAPVTISDRPADDSCARVWVGSRAVWLRRDGAVGLKIEFVWRYYC